MNQNYRTVRQAQIEPLVARLSAEGHRLTTTSISPLSHNELGDMGMAILRKQADEIYSDIQKLQEELRNLK